MKIRLLLAAAVVVLAANGATPPGNKLSTEQKILHVLDRLTFGARPGDFEEVRRLGVEKWIELQLHPERIAENPALEARLKPLDTIRMETGRNLHEVFPAVSAGIRPACPFERTAARRTVPQGLQRHRGGAARGHHGARPGKTHEGARRRAPKRSGGPAGPSEGTGRRTPEECRKSGRWKCGACGRRSTNCCPRSRSRSRCAERRRSEPPCSPPWMPTSSRGWPALCRPTRLPASPNCAAWARCRARRSRW